jgi:TonB family protein
LLRINESVIVEVRLTRFLAISVAHIWSNILQAQEIAIETFTPPQVIEVVNPEFVSSQFLQASNGFGALNFMVDTDGSAFDPVVLESTDNEEFNDAAINAILQSRFEPARLAGQPIVGSLKVVIPFNSVSIPDLTDGLSPPKTGEAAPQFRAAYSRFRRALESGDRETIEDELARLERQDTWNLNEYVFLGLARYGYASLYGSEIDQLRHIRQTLLFGWLEDPGYLDEGLIRNLRRIQFSLQVTNNYFGDAIDTFRLIESSGDTVGAAMFEGVIEKLEEIRLDDTEYFIPLNLGEHGQTSLRLFRHKVAMTQGEGDLNEAVLRCDRKYVAFSIERDISYDVPAEWGECWIQIMGSADANFLLLQH